MRSSSRVSVSRWALFRLGYDGSFASKRNNKFNSNVFNETLPGSSSETVEVFCFVELFENGFNCFLTVRKFTVGLFSKP